MPNYPQFFETVEKLYLMYEVPDEVQAKLLIPLLTTQAKSLVNCMSVTQMGVSSVENADSAHLMLQNHIF